MGFRYINNGTAPVAGSKGAKQYIIRTYIYGICEQVLLRKESLDNCILIIKFTSKYTAGKTN